MSIQYESESMRMDTVRGNIVCLSVSVCAYVCVCVYVCVTTARHHMTVFLFIQREYSEHNWGGTSQLLLSKENNRCNGESSE